MKAVALAVVFGAAVVALPAESVWGQCRGGNGGGTATTAATTGGAGGAVTGTLLTGPGSWAYDVMMQQQMQAAYMQRQMALVKQKAQADQAKKAARIATHSQRRLSELYRRDARRESLAAANQRQ